MARFGGFAVILLLYAILLETLTFLLRSNTCIIYLLVKPCTDVASNLLAIDLRFNVQIACDGLQQKFQHAE